MDAYDERLAPAPFGLNNTGAICYFNGLLQALAGCTALTRAVLADPAYLRRTVTGTALLAFVEAYSRGASNNIAHHSAAIQQALVADLTARRPHVHFGSGQESASEALVHLLDMLELPGEAPGSGQLTRLFLHRFRCDLRCRACGAISSTATDHAVNSNLFHIDQMAVPPGADVARFTAAVCFQASELDTGAASGPTPCAKCGAALQRVYYLTMAPEIILCMFNLYGPRPLREFPPQLCIPALGGGGLDYRLVGQVEHAGTLAGGHYWARGLRAGGRVYLFNDASVAASEFAATPSTYIVAYHYGVVNLPGAVSPPIPHL